MMPFKTLGLSATLLLGACATGGPDRTDLTPPIQGDGYRLDAALQPLADAPAHDWWRSFEDPALTGLIEAGLVANRTVQEGAANVARARAALGLQQTERRPTGEVTGLVDYGEQAVAGGRALGSAEAETFISIGAALRWELDFFGRIARLTDAAEADLAANEWDLRDLQAILVSEIASAYLDVRSSETGIRIADRNRVVQQETVDLTSVRFEEGATARIDVVRASAQLRTTEALIPPFRADRSTAVNRLATLTGSTVDAVEAMLAREGAGILATPESLPLGDITGLLQRRADIRQAEQEWVASMARAGAQRRDYFPTISLLGSVDAAATDFYELGGPGSVGFGVGPTLSWAGFDIPRVRAGIGIADAEADAALARYEQAVFLAVEETQAAFDRFARGREQVALLDIAVRDSQEASELARLRYEEGADDFLSVLDAEARLLTAESDLLEAQEDLAQAIIDVYRALGAGWQEDGQMRVAAR